MIIYQVIVYVENVMNLNLDRNVRLAINTTEMEWQESPSKGVYRKKLERERAESGVITSVVKYGRGTSFSAHAHPSGEEIFVLEGVFKMSMVSFQRVHILETLRAQAIHLKAQKAASCL